MQCSTNQRDVCAIERTDGEKIKFTTISAETAGEVFDFAESLQDPDSFSISSCLT